MGHATRMRATSIRTPSIRIGLTAAALTWVTALPAAGFTGAGSTFPYPVYASWAEAYKQETGIELSYQGIGSGGGIRQINARAVTFGATDMPLEAHELRESGLVQFPLILGAIVLVVKIQGITAGQLVLDGPTLAAIYLGDIRRWDDPALRALNPELLLPAMRITPVYRSDGSRANLLFTTYLSQVSARFRERVGAGPVVSWPVGADAKGDGIANGVDVTPGAIGYVEYAYAARNKLVFTDLINQAGVRLSPGPAPFQAAAAHAPWESAPGYHLLLTNQPGADSWPIVGASFILMPALPADRRAAGEALKFFDWAYRNGAPLAQDLGYVPLPLALIRSVRATWKSQIVGVTLP